MGPPLCSSTAKSSIGLAHNLLKRWGVAHTSGRGRMDAAGSVLTFWFGPTSLKREEGLQPCRHAWVGGELRWKGGGGGGKRRDERVSHMSCMLKLHSPPMIMVAYCVRSNDNEFLAVGKCRICIYSQIQNLKSDNKKLKMLFKIYSLLGKSSRPYLSFVNSIS